VEGRAEEEGGGGGGGSARRVGRAAVSSPGTPQSRAALPASGCARGAALPRCAGGRAAWGREGGARREDRTVDALNQQVLELAHRANLELGEEGVVWERL